MKKTALLLFIVYMVIASSCGECLAVNIGIGGMMLKKNVKCLREIKDQYVVKQTLDYSCGPAGLATVFNYYIGVPISEHQILNELLGIVDINKVKERKGFSLLDLKKFAESKGYKVTGYQMDMDFLRELGQPVLIPIRFKNYRHFVVVKGVVGDRVFFADPAMGNMTMKTDRFIDIWQQGIGLVVEYRISKSGKGRLLSVKKEDLVMPDYKNVKRNIGDSVIRTAVFPSEF